MILVRGNGLFLMLAALVLALVLVVSPSQAQKQPKIPTCSNYQNGQMSSGYVGLTNHIVGCIRETLDGATDKFFTGFYPIVSKGISAAMTMAVIVFGILGAFGMLEKIGRDSIVLLLKLACVSYFSTQSDLVYHTMISAMDSTARAVVEYVPSNGPSDGTGGDFSQVTCLKKMKEAQTAINTSSPGNQKAVSGPWLAMDCMIDSVIGIKVESAGGIKTTALSDVKAYNENLSDDDQGLSRGLLYLFFSSWQSSVLGVIVAVLGFIFLWGMITMIIKALFIYISGYLGLAVMVIVSPLLIPLVLFQSTKVYFDKWVKLLISFALQPIIILVFVALTIAAVDLATFSGKYSVMYRIAGDASQQKGFSLNSYLTQQRGGGGGGDKQTAIIQDRKWDLGFVKADNVDSKDSTPIKKIVDGGLIDQLTQSDCAQALQKADPKITDKCGQSYAVGLTRTKLDWDLMASARQPAVQLNGAKNAGEAIAREVLSAVIFAAVVIFVMNQLLSVIPVVAYDLFGDFGQSPNLAQAGGTLPWQGGMRSSLRQMASSKDSR